ncbi:hypothetical protein RB195_007754 [Necator americanus]|uniref:GOLD domain-containing protein n=1 Tax=Necator americanus TaxID=51031 RepID=A0ABR1BYS1_NECAM
MLLLTFYSVLLWIFFHQSILIESYVQYVEISMIMDSKAMCVYVGYESGTILHVNLLQRSAVNPSMSLRLTPPSGIYTQWDQKRKGAEVFREHNLTETGDYEICILVPRPLRVTLVLFAFHPIRYSRSIEESFKTKELTENFIDAHNKLMDNLFHIIINMRYYITVSASDEMMQQANSFYIQAYVIVFCAAAIIVAMLQAHIVRSMFEVDPTKIRP